MLMTAYDMGMSQRRIGESLRRALSYRLKPGEAFHCEPLDAGDVGKKTAVVSTINGDANVPFYKELGNQGVKAKDIAVVAFSVGEEELAGLERGTTSRTFSPLGKN
jgi:hypothetical protein